MKHRKRSIPLQLMKRQFLKKGYSKRWSAAETCPNEQADIRANSKRSRKMERIDVKSNISDETKDFRKEKTRICKFKDAALNEIYELIPSKTKKAPFGRCYFAKHRESKATVLIAMIFQHVFDEFKGNCGDGDLQRMMKEADPNLGGLRETIQCSGAVALVMDISTNCSRKIQTRTNEINTRATEPQFEDGSELSLEAETEDGESMTDSSLETGHFTVVQTPNPQRKSLLRSSFLSCFCSPPVSNVGHDDEHRKEIKSVYFQGEDWSIASTYDATAASTHRKIITIDSMDESIEKSVERRMDQSTANSSVEAKPKLTVWFLLSTLEMADCMPLADFDKSFDDIDSSADLFSVEQYAR